MLNLQQIDSPKTQSMLAIHHHSTVQQHYDAAFCTTLCVSLSGNLSIPAVIGKEKKVKLL